MNTLHKHKGRMVFLGDADYPHLLAMLPDPPPVLSVLGDISVLSTRSVGLVGARNASANGQRMAEALATELAGQAITIVSGMARGIDAAAHEGALHVGRTVAAVAGGLDQPYPAEHSRSAGTHRFRRCRGDGGALGHRTAKSPFSAPQPHHRRPRARRGGRGSPPCAAAA